MDSIDHFYRQILLVVKDKEEADRINRTFVHAGAMALEVETSITNVVARLRDANIEACIITSASLSNNFNDPKIGCERLLQAIKADPLAARKPIILIEYAPELDIDYYTYGITAIIEDGIDEAQAHICLLQLESVLSILDLYKARERNNLFRV